MGHADILWLHTERFQATGAVRFIMGSQPNITNSVKAYLRENEILDDMYNLTTKGE
jgi:hypothetical protein